jgi:murein DD-endopeptidase MepM/ murein hydrolase activator NlpD
MTIYFEPFSPKTRGDEFGNLAHYRNGRPHRGQDWSPKLRSKVKAITDGTVFVSTWTDGLGWIVIHSTKDGYWVLYAHLAEKSLLVKGDKVVGGKTVLGKIGNTGAFSTGAHLHLSIGKANKDWSNPNIHLSAYEDLIDPLKHILENKGK